MKNLFKIVSFLVVIPLLMSFLVSCGTDGEDAKLHSGYISIDESESMIDSIEKSPSENTDVNEQKYVITAEFRCESKNFDEDQTALKAKIDELGGYFENYSVSGRTDSKQLNSKVRIPKDKIQNFFDFLNEKFEVTAQSSQRTNITQSYYEAQSHYETLKVSEERVLELLKSAKDLDDMLKLETQLAGIRQQIQYYESLLKSFDNQVDYATVTVTVYSVAVYTEPESETFFSKIKNAFVTSWKDFAEGCGNFAIFFVEAVPTLLVLGFIAFVIVLIVKLSIRSARKKRAKKNTNA